MPLKERLSTAMENAVRGVFQTHCPDLDIEQIIQDTDFSLYDPVKSKTKTKTKSKNPPKKASVSHMERALLPFNSDKGQARIWGSGFGCQCNSKPSDSGTFCKTHTASQNFGLFDGPKPDEHSWKIAEGVVVDAVALIEDPPDIPESPKKPVKKKQKKELSPEIIALKDEYESILGKKPAGRRCNDPLWLEQKINEKKDPPPVKMKKDKKDKKVKKPPPPEEPEEDIAEDIDELAEDLENPPEYTEFEYQNVQYLLDEETNEAFNAIPELIGHLEDGVINFINETFRTRHKQECGSDESDDESDEASDDDSDGE